MTYDIEAFFGTNTPIPLTVEETIDLFVALDEPWNYQIIEEFLKDLRIYLELNQ